MSFGAQPGYRQAHDRPVISCPLPSPSPEVGKAILDKYGVEYVYVGRPEREVYGEEGLARFAALGRVVYQQDQVTIYRVER